MQGGAPRPESGAGSTRARCRLGTQHSSRRPAQRQCTRCARLAPVCTLCPTTSTQSSQFCRAAACHSLLPVAQGRSGKAYILSRRRESRNRTLHRLAPLSCSARRRVGPPLKLRHVLTESGKLAWSSVYLTATLDTCTSAVCLGVWESALRGASAPAVQPCLGHNIMRSH